MIDDEKGSWANKIVIYLTVIVVNSTIHLSDNYYVHERESVCVCACVSACVCISMAVCVYAFITFLRWLILVNFDYFHRYSSD